MVYDIELHSVKDVIRLNHLLRQVDEPIWVHTRDNSIMVDGKSILSLFTLINKDCMLVANDTISRKTLKKIAEVAKLI